jgi:outer membrane receptor protein involved in Fe transport
MAYAVLDRKLFAVNPLALAALICIAGNAWAQAAPPADAASAPAAAAADKERKATQTPQTVFVTANRRRELAKDVAGTVNVLGGARLEQLDIASTSDLVGYVPGLQVDGDGPGYKRLSLRGITTGSLQISPSVAAYLDEQPVSLSSSVSAGALFGTDIDPLDLERIEVLKGPQGSLYGASALGGLIKYVTVAPNLKDLEGRAELGYSRASHGGTGHTARAAVNVPLIRDLLASRLTVYDRKEPGYVDDTLRKVQNVNSTTNSGARLTTLFKPNRQFDAKLVLDTQTLKSPDASVPQYDAQTLQPRFGVDGGQYAAAQPMKHTYDRGALTLNLDLGFANLLSVTSYLHMKNDVQIDYTKYVKFLDTLTVGAYAGLGFTVTPLDFDASIAGMLADTKKKVQELRLVSPGGGRFDWLAGVFFQEESTDIPTEYRLFKGTAVTPYIVAGIQAKLRESAGYANATWHLNKNFDIQAGVRYAKLQQDYATGIGSYNYFTNSVPAPSLTSAVSREDKTTWMISPRWAIDQNHMVYFRAASGYRPGGPNVPLLNGMLNPPFSSDSIVNYEAGYKGVFPAAQADVTAALFNIDWKNIQVTAIDAAAGSSYYTNGGKAHSRGLELEAGWRPVPGLRLSGNLTAMQAKLDEDVAAIGGKKGDDIPFTPKLTASLSADYSWGAGPGQMSAGASVRHSDTRRVVFSSQSASPLAPAVQAPELPAYSLLDLRASYRFDAFTLSLFVKNALNKRVPINYNGIQVLPDQATGALTPANVGVMPPRTFNVSLRVDF